MIIVALAFTLAVSAQSLFVGTYNVRYQNNGDARRGNGWAVRSKSLCEQINFEHPDIFGTQEAMIGQIRDMLRMMPDYSYIGLGRDDGKEAGEHSAIFYDRNRLQLLQHGDFWLSEHPDKPGLGWDAACVRICTWGQFKLKKPKLKFFYFNLHMDHVGVVARREAAKLVVQKIREIAQGAPVILTGDFNVDQNNEIYQIFTQSGILKDSYTAARQRFAENGTFNDFDTSLKTESRIDHIFVSPAFEVDHYGVLTNSYWTPDPDSDGKKLKGDGAPQEIDFQKYTRRNPSDHYPVLAKIRYVK